MLVAQNAAKDASVAESSTMALSKSTDNAAQAGSYITNIAAPTLGSINDYLLDFQTTAQALTSTLYGELDAIFSCINIHDISPSYLDKTSKSASRPASKLHHPAYIVPAYQWLLANIHNPYPSKEVRTQIARKAKSDIKSVEAWFVDARGRIGWNALRKTYFGNKRAEIVDAATRFFVKLDDKRPLGTTIEFEFAQMEISAKNLYSDRFVETTLVTKLDVAVKDLTPEMKQKAKTYAREEVQRAKAASSYPSPRHSPDRSPEPVELSPPFEQDRDLASTPLDALARRKRRSLSPEDDSVISDRPVKRVRAEPPPPVSTCLPSPTPSSHGPLPRSPTPRSSSPDSTSLPIHSRKRRLSQANEQSNPKRPRDASIAPLHITSDPFPMPPSTSFDSGLDNWFDPHLGFLNPVQVDPLDDDTQGLALDFYTYSASEVDTPASTSTEPLAGISCLTLTPEFSCEVPRALPASHSPLSQLSSLTNLPPVPSYSDVLSPANATQPTDPNANIDWNHITFEQLSDPFGGFNLLQDLNRNNDSQTPSTISTVFFPEIVPSLTNLTASSRSDDVKVELLLRLATMKEEMRRLEKQITEA
ncbi:hypothetical protein C0992_006021 [Termitomyces sp. T32_za158]|nr:hypothetical protein C0992_006021 [Termitomyces sp. T32_za158]